MLVIIKATKPQIKAPTTIRTSYLTHRPPGAFIALAHDLPRFKTPRAEIPITEGLGWMHWTRLISQLQSFVGLHHATYRTGSIVKRTIVYALCLCLYLHAQYQIGCTLFMLLACTADSALSSQ
jgi:hypothetical protein